MEFCCQKFVCNLYMYITHSLMEVYVHVLCCSVLQNRAEVMRKQGKDVSVDVICNGLIALQGKQTLADRCSKISITSCLLKRFRQTVQTHIRLLLKKQYDQVFLVSTVCYSD